MGAWSWLTNLWGPIDDVPVASASSVPLTEAGLPLLLTGSDQDATMTLAQGGGPTFRRLSQSERDLPSFTLDRGREIAWALYEANPHLKLLRRQRHQQLPLITISGGINRIRLALSTERPSDQNARHTAAGQQPLRRK